MALTNIVLFLQLKSLDLSYNNLTWRVPDSWSSLGMVSSTGNASSYGSDYSSSGAVGVYTDAVCLTCLTFLMSFHV